MSFLSLPNELIYDISAYVSAKDVDALACCNQRLLIRLTEEIFRKKRGWNAMIWAIENNNRLAATELMTVHGVNPDVTDERGVTPLHHAAWSRKPLMTELLLTHGADPLKKSNVLKDADTVGVDLMPQFRHPCYGMTAVHFAALGNCKESMRLLHEGGADLNTSLQYVGDRANYVASGSLLPIQAAANNGSVDVLNYLLDNGKDVNCADSIGHRGYSPLLCAIFTDKHEAVRCLLNRGADVNYEFNFLDPLWLAASGHAGRVRSLKVLLDFKGRINNYQRGVRNILEGCSEEDSHFVFGQRGEMIYQLLNAFLDPAVNVDHIDITDEEHASSGFSYGTPF